MQEEKEKRISQSTVIGLGFTKTMIDKLLPPPVLVKNPHYKSSPPMKLWLESEVMEIMQTAEYQREKEKADKRRSAAKKAVATKTNNLSRQIDNMIGSIRIKIIADDVLVRRTIQFKQNWLDAHRDEVENYKVINSGVNVCVILGLVNALVAAMPGIVSALMATLPTLIQGVQDLISGVVAVLPELLQTIIDTAVTLVPMIAQAIIDMLPVLLDTGLAMIEGLAQSILEAIPVLIAALPELINSIVTFILGAIPQIIETGISLLTALVEALPTIIETIVAVLPQIVENIITNLLNMIPLIVDAGITLLISLVQALPTIITTIIDAVPKIVNSICDVFINNIDKIIDAGVQLFIALVSNLPTIITEILKAVPQIITSLVNAIGESVPKIAEAGTNLVKGLFNGISNAVSWLYGKLRGWVSSVLSYIKSLFGIHSPATTTAKFGMYVAKGLGVGIEENTDSATDAAAEMGEKVLDTFSDVTDEINNVQKDMFSGANTDFEIKAGVNYDTSGAVTSEVESSVDVTNNGLINGLSSVFNNLTNKVDSVGNKIVNAIMNTNGVAPAGRSVIVNFGGMHVSGLIGDEAVTQIEDIANGIVDDVVTSVVAVLPA